MQHVNRSYHETMLIDWIETSNGNRISKRAKIKGSQRILIAGMCVISEYSIINGNVPVFGDASHSLSMGIFCIVGQHCVIESPVIEYKIDGDSKRKKSLHAPLYMGSYILVKEGAQIYGKRLGRRIVIGTNATLSRCCTFGDTIIVDSNVTVPENCHVPSLTRVRKHPKWPESIVFEPLNERFRNIIEDWCKQEYLGIDAEIEELLDA